MSREELFERAWQRPLTELADEMGITSTGLKKVCDRHDIPTPGRGYWAQVRAGKTFSRPKLAPARSAALEEVQIIGARALPAAVAEAMQRARDLAPKSPRSRRRTSVQSTPRDPALAVDDSHLVGGEEGDVVPAPMRKDLDPTGRAIGRARVDESGFGAASGNSVIPLAVSPTAQAAALEFLTKLLERAEARGWKLQPSPQGALLIVEGEPLSFHVEEQPRKTPHEPTSKELALKKDRDRWGGDSQPWRTWDLSPSGRLALVIGENDYSGLRRTYSQRKGYAFAESLDVILTGFAAHAALKVERRHEAEALAKAAAEAEARRQRLEAFDHREKQRSDFAAAIGEALAERTRLQAVLGHLEALPEGPRHGPAGMEAWLRRRLSALDARLDPVALEISARHSEVGFDEPPSGKETSRWYAPPVVLHLWIPAAEEGRVSGVSELEWAIAKRLIEDPGELGGEDHLDQ